MPVNIKNVAIARFKRRLMPGVWDKLRHTYVYEQGEVEGIVCVWPEISDARLVDSEKILCFFLEGKYQLLLTTTFFYYKCPEYTKFLGYSSIAKCSLVKTDPLSVKSEFGYQNLNLFTVEILQEKNKLYDIWVEEGTALATSEAINYIRKHS